MSDATPCNCEYCGIYNRYLTNLVRIHQFLQSLQEGNHDGLRLLIAFIHSVFEDTLRGFMYTRYRNGHEDWTSDLPLPDIDNRKSKFTLGELHAAYGPDATIRSLKDAAVAHAIDMATFNDTEQLAGRLTSVGFDVEPIRNEFAALQTGIQRRHKVVHEADIDPDSDQPRAIVPADVATFAIAVAAVVLNLHGQTHDKQLVIEDLPNYETMFSPFLLRDNPPQ